MIRIEARELEAVLSQPKPRQRNVHDWLGPEVSDGSGLEYAYMIGTGKRGAVFQWQVGGFGETPPALVHLGMRVWTDNGAQQRNRQEFFLRIFNPQETVTSWDEAKTSLSRRYRVSGSSLGERLSDALGIVSR